MSHNPPGKTTPLIVVISGPSGAGKDTLIDRMAELGHNHHFTVTATTREPRPHEKDGVNHFFVAKDRFLAMVNHGELLEWAEVYGNYYGVPRDQVRRALQRGQHVMVRVDVQGAHRIKEIAPEALFIFVMPPSKEVLKRRLIQRGVNSAEDMERRLSAAESEIKEAHWFDYRVVNEEGRLDETVRKVAGIIDGESRRMPPRKIVI